MNEREKDIYLRGFLSSRTTLTVQSGKSFHKRSNWWEFRLEPVIVVCGRFESQNILNALKERFGVNSITKRKINSFKTQFRSRGEVTELIDFLKADMFNESFVSKVKLFEEICEHRWNYGGKKSLLNVINILNLKEQLNSDGYKKRESVYLFPDEVIDCYIYCYGKLHYEEEYSELPTNKKIILNEMIRGRQYTSCS